MPNDALTPAANRMHDAIRALLVSLATGRLARIAETQRQSLLIRHDLLEGPEVQTLSDAADAYAAAQKE